MSETSNVHPSVWVAPSAQLYGRIAIGAESSVWPNVVVRAECNEVRIGRYTNLQDFVMIHIGYGHGTIVGDFCSVTHHATLHGCTIEDDCLIGINAVVMDGAVVGHGSIVAGGAMIKEGSVFPPGSIVAGVPAKQIGERDSARANRLNAWQYHYNARAYARGEHRAWTGPDYERWLADITRRVECDEDLVGLR
ncbi:MAG TPA: gamma carbonic anhydrase family protein [Myxococcota bacterium]|nr:gamma carbonic anhydrase family protein [Myxococcota bacterium]